MKKEKEISYCALCGLSCQKKTNKYCSKDCLWTDNTIRRFQNKLKKRGLEIYKIKIYGRNKKYIKTF